MPLRLQTERTILRPWADSDIEPWVALNADARVMEFFPSTYTRERAERSAALLRERLERVGYGWWVLEIKDGASFAGVIALQDVPFEAPFTPALEIGWRLRHDHWGHGYATEGARAALAFAFSELQRDEVVALTAAVNDRSRRVMKRLGMTRNPEDDFEHPAVEPGHPVRPHVLYRIRRNG
jgi:RimJ/RimL family protein N-acetyltransferase